MNIKYCRVSHFKLKISWLLICVLDQVVPVFFRLEGVRNVKTAGNNFNYREMDRGFNSLSR